MKAIATESLRLYPPDNVPAKSFVLLSRSTSFIAYFTALEISEVLTPLKTANSSKCSLTVRSGNKISCCGHRPIYYLISSKLSLKFNP